MTVRITRRNFVRTAGAVAAMAAAPAVVRAQAERKSIKVGWAISKTGPFTGGANASQIPNYRLWVDDVNKAGGINMGGKKLPIEVVEYDDRSQSEELVRAVDRLVSQDKVDFLLPPWGTGMNMAVAPAFHRGNFPMIAPSFITDRMPELVKRWDNIFSLLQPATPYGEAIVGVLKDLRTAGKIGNKVAVVNVTDQFGLELSKAARTALAKEKFEIVYDAGYPIATQDLTPIIAAAQQKNPDVFLAFSYPPDTFALTDAARVRGFNPKVFYAGVGTALAVYPAKFGDAIEGVMGPGGWNPHSQAITDYTARHKALTGTLPDHWVSALCYSGLQALQQSIEKVGKVDRPAIIKVLNSTTFDTITGPLTFKNHIMTGSWLVGQWQGGVFHGVAPNQEGVKPVIAKPVWKA